MPSRLAWLAVLGTGCVNDLQVPAPTISIAAEVPCNPAPVTSLEDLDGQGTLLIDLGAPLDPTSSSSTASILTPTCVDDPHLEGTFDTLPLRPEEAGASEGGIGWLGGSCGCVPPSVVFRTPEDQPLDALAVTEGPTHWVLVAEHLGARRSASLLGYDGGALATGTPVELQWSPSTDALTGVEFVAWVLGSGTDGGAAETSERVALDLAGLQAGGGRLAFSIPPCGSGAEVAATLELSLTPRVDSCEGPHACRVDTVGLEVPLFCHP